MRPVLITCMLFFAAACASTPGPAAPPNLAPPSGSAAPAHARLYADCVAAAARASSYDRMGNTIRFHCRGEPAQRFFDALAAWSAAHNSEFVVEGRTLRVTQRPERDLSGLDYCWREAGGAYGCTIVLNAGEFLDAE